MKKIIVIMLSLVVVGCGTAGDIDAKAMSRSLAMCDKNGGTVRANVVPTNFTKSYSRVKWVYCQDGAIFRYSDEQN